MGSYNIGCLRVDELFMKYMDGLISAEELESISTHLCECGQCSEDFEIYATIRDTLGDNAAAYTAPEGFEAAVMQKITELPDRSAKTFATGYVWIGAVAVSAGALGLALLPGHIPAFDAYLESLRAFMIGVGTVISGTAIMLLEVIAQAQIVLLCIFICLTLIQFVVYKQDRAW